MRSKSWLLILAASCCLTFVVSCKKDGPAFCNCSPNELVASVSVYADGLNNPRGLKFGPDGNLYVAEGGIGGSFVSTGCDQVVPPVGPYTGSVNGSRIIKISGSHKLVTVANDLPSSQTSPDQGGLVSGVGDIAFIGNTLYGVLAGAGCSHGVPSIPNGVVKVNGDKTWSITADLSAFQKTHPVANPFPGDFEPDGTWYSMVSVNGSLYAIEPNHGELDKITTHGVVSRVADISKTQGHIVPTAMVYHDGNFYVGNLNNYPIVPGSANVYKITPEGKVTIYAKGFSDITGIGFDKLGALYVLENTTANPFPTPGTGDVVRVDPSGSRNVVVTGLNLPTALVFGADDKMYISNWGFGPPAIGGGQVLQVELTCAKTSQSLKG